MNGCLYVIGGYDGANYLASVERYDPRVSSYSYSYSTLELNHWVNICRKENGLVYHR